MQQSSPYSEKLVSFTIPKSTLFYDIIVTSRLREPDIVLQPIDSWYCEVEESYYPKRSNDETEPVLILEMFVRIWKSKHANLAISNKSPAHLIQRFLRMRYDQFLIEHSRLSKITGGPHLTRHYHDRGHSCTFKAWIRYCCLRWEMTLLCETCRLLAEYKLHSTIGLVPVEPQISRACTCDGRLSETRWCDDPYRRKKLWPDFDPVVNSLVNQYFGRRKQD